MTDEISYGKTYLGQRLYDFGFSRLTDQWLARKYQMKLAEVREERRLMRAKLRGTRKSERARTKSTQSERRR